MTPPSFTKPLTVLPSTANPDTQARAESTDDSRTDTPRITTPANDTAAPVDSEAKSDVSGRVLSGKQMIKVATGTIPDIKELKSAIDKKWSSSPLQMNNIPRMYVQDVKETAPVRIISQDDGVKSGADITTVSEEAKQNSIDKAPESGYNASVTDNNSSESQIYENKEINTYGRTEETISDARNAESARGVGEEITRGEGSVRERVSRRIKEILRKSSVERRNNSLNARKSARLEQRETGSPYGRDVPLSERERVLTP